MNLIQEAHEFLTGWCQIQLVLPAVLRVNVADNMMKFLQLARVAGNAGFVQGVVFGDVLLTAAGMVADIQHNQVHRPGISVRCNCSLQCPDSPGINTNQTK